MEKESKMEGKRNNKILIVFLVIMVVIVLGLVGYIVWDKVLRDVAEDKPPVSTIEPTPTIDVTPDMTPSPEEEEVEISLELAEQLYNMIYDWEECGSGLFEYYQYDKVLANDFSNEYKNHIVKMNLYSSNYKDGTTSNGDPIYTLTTIMNVKNRVLGFDTSFELIASSGCKNLNSIGDNQYTLDYSCGGRMCSPSVRTKFERTIQKDDKIYLIQLVLFEQSENLESGYTSFYYQDYNHSNLIATEEFADFDDYLVKYDQFDWSKYENNAGIYQYTFQTNTDGTYMFLQLERLR